MRSCGFKSHLPHNTKKRLTLFRTFCIISVVANKLSVKCDMRKCRNWQTSKTKDLVIIAIVWVQVPSSALNNKTGIKQNVWSLSCCSKPKRALNPWFKVSPPARSARGMRSPGPHSPHLPQDYGRGRAGAHGSKVSAPLRSLQNRHPPDVLQPIFRKASVVAEQAPYID